MSRGHPQRRTGARHVTPPLCATVQFIHRCLRRRYSSTTTTISSSSSSREARNRRIQFGETGFFHEAEFRILLQWALEDRAPRGAETGMNGFV
jgi:hypothetical protein